MRSRTGERVRLTDAHKAELQAAGLYHPSDEREFIVLEHFSGRVYVLRDPDGPRRHMHEDNFEPATQKEATA